MPGEILKVVTRQGGVGASLHLRLARFPAESVSVSSVSSFSNGGEPTAACTTSGAAPTRSFCWSSLRRLLEVPHRVRIANAVGCEGAVWFVAG